MRSGMLMLIDICIVIVIIVQVRMRMLVLVLVVLLGGPGERRRVRAQRLLAGRLHQIGRLRMRKEWNHCTEQHEREGETEHISPARHPGRSIEYRQTARMHRESDKQQHSREVRRCACCPSIDER
jgi:hypothetical protein